MTRLLSILLAAAALSGCAALNSVSSDVSTYSRWPSGRAPQSYAFERLPSQQAEPQTAQMLEAAAMPAIEAAGFVPVAEGRVPDVTVQVGARITATDRSPFDDPFWYGPYGHWHRPFGPRGFGFGGYGGFYGFGGFGGYPGWGLAGYGGPGNYGFPYYEREAAVLIRDKRSGEALYESRSVSEGTSASTGVVLPAMFSAALRDFPAGSTKNPHRVVVDARQP